MGELIRRRKGTFILSLLAAIAVIAGWELSGALAQGSDPDPCPIETAAYWKLDEGTGEISYDAVGRRHAILHGGTWTTGLIDKAIAFNGTSDYLEVDDHPDLEVGSAITLEAWVKVGGSTGDYQSVISKHDPAANDRSYYLYLTPDLKLQFGLSPDGATAIKAYGDSVLSVDTWHHVAGVSDGTTMQVYLDGAPNGATTAAPATINDSGAHLRCL